MTSCLMVIVIFSIYHQFQNIDSQNVLDLDLDRWNEVKYKYANRKPIHDLIVDSNHNVLVIIYYFHDILCQNVHDLDIDL